MDLGRLIVRLVLERKAFGVDMAQATAEAEQAAGKLEGATSKVNQAAQKALNTQGAAGRATAGALELVAPAAGSAAVGVGLLAAGVVAAAVAYQQGSKEAQAYEKALILTGNASGTTAGQMADMARNIELVVGTQGKAAETLAAMASTGKVAGGNLEKFSQEAIQMERTVSQSVDDTVKVFERLGDAPVAASLKLNDSMNYLTAATYAQIKAAEELGDKEGAASLAQDAYAGAMEDRMKRVEASLGFVQTAWREIADIAKKGWDAMLNVGRPDTLAQQMDSVRQKIAQAQGQDKNRPFSMPWDTPLADLQQQLANLSEQERLIRRGTEAQTERNRVEKAGIEAIEALGKANDSARTKQERAEKALDDYRKNLEKLRAANPASELLNPDTIAKTEAAILKSGETRSRVTRQAISEQEKLAQAGEKLADSLLAQDAGLSSNFTGDWEKLSAAYAANRITLGELVQAQAELLEKQPGMQAAAKAEAAVRADLAKTMAEYEKAQAGGVAEAERAATQAEQQLATYGLLKSEVQELTLATLEQARESAALAGEDVANIEQRIAAQKRLIAATRGIEQKDDFKKAATEAQNELQRVTDQYAQGLTNAAMEGGKSLKKYITGMLRTTAFRILLDPIMKPLAGLVAGVTGTAAQAAGTGAAGSMGTSLLGSALGGIGAFGTGASYGMAGLMSGNLTGMMAAGGQMIGAGSVMSGLGTIAGALGPIAIGIALLGSLIKKSTPHMGGGSSYSADGGIVTGAAQYQQRGAYGFDDTRTYTDAAGKLTADLARSVVGILDTTATAFGREAGYTAATAFADDSSKDGAWGSLLISQMDRAVVNWEDGRASKWAPREFSDGDKGSAEYLAAIAASTRDALTAMDLPGWADDVLASIGDAPTLESLTQAVTAINTGAAALVQMGKNLVGFAGLTSSAVDALVKAAGGMDALAASASTYYDNFYSDAERAANVTRDVTASLAAVGLQMPATREAFRALVEAQMALGEPGAAAVAALLGVSGAFASVVESVDQMQEQLRSASLNSLQRAVDYQKRLIKAQIDAAQEAVSGLSGLFDLLRSNARDLYRDVSSTAAMQSAQGNAFITQALATARSTGYMPDADNLAEAISAARGGIDGKQYTSQFDADRDRLVLAGKLAELGDMAEGQLTTAERTLRELQLQSDGLDKTLGYWRDLLEGTAGNTGAVLSVAQAVRDLQVLMFPETSPDFVAPTPPGEGRFSAGPGGGGGGGGATYNKADNIKDTFASVDLGNLRDAAITASIKGFTQADIAAAYGYDQADIERIFAAQGIPKFAAGGMHGGGLRLVGERGPEIEATGPARIWNQQQMANALGGGSARLEALVEGLTERVQSLQSELSAIRANTAQMPEMAAQFDNATEGGNAMRSKTVGAA